MVSKQVLKRDDK